MTNFRYIKTRHISVSGFVFSVSRFPYDLR
ncbi:hypothetical protein VPH5P1C_0072 [Vibrio phage 5P1c]